MKLFFDHIPKTAGTSLQVFFAEAFGEDRVTPTQRSKKFTSALTIYKDYAVIIGHFNFIPGDNLPSGYICATVLRDPRERTLSDYYYSVNIASGRAVKLLDVIEAMNRLSGYEMEMRVNPAFVRTNEIKELTGSPDKLVGITGINFSFGLDGLLSSMYLD